MKTIKVELDEKTIEIKKLPLRQYAEFIEALEEIPKNLADFGTLSNDEIVSKLPEIIKKALPNLAKVISVATPLNVEEVYELGAGELTDVVLGVVEINRYKEVYDKVKKAIGQQSKQNKK